MPGSSAAATKALSKHLPKAAADTDSKYGVQRYATATTNTSVDMPEAWRGKWVTFHSDGTDTQVAYGDGATGPTLVYDQASAIGTGHVSAGATCKDGLPRDFLVPNEATRLAWISLATGGFFEMHLSELNRIGRRK